MSITNINHITLAVSDIHRSFEFYKDVLGFQPLVKWDQGAYFLIGDFWFCLNVDLARIFHTDRDEEAAKPGGVRQANILTQGCMSTYCPSQNVSLTQHPSVFPDSAVDQHEISGLAREPQPCYTHYAFSISTEDFEWMADNIASSGAPIFQENISPGESLYFLDPDGHKLEIHVGNSQTRIATKKAHSGNWKNVEWFV